jgi:hypothetical protein
VLDRAVEHPGRDAGVCAVDRGEQESGLSPLLGSVLPQQNVHTIDAVTLVLMSGSLAGKTPRVASQRSRSWHHRQYATVYSPLYDRACRP